MKNEPDIFAEQKARAKQLLAQLSASPIVDVTGIVDANGPGGGMSRGEDHWTLTFTLEAWKLRTGSLQTRPLNVRRKVTEDELRSFQEQIQPDTIVRLRARVVVDSLLGNPAALLEAYDGVEASDAELIEHLSQLQKPVMLEDSVLGVFTLDRRIDWLTAQVVWDANPISLHLKATQAAEVQAALKSAHALWANQDAWNRRIRDYAVQRLLPLKNDSWLQEDEAELTSEQFESKMTLESIIVYPDGAFDFYHKDGDLFWGHSVQISGSLTEGPTHADIPG